VIAAPIAAEPPRTTQSRPHETAADQEAPAAKAPVPEPVFDSEEDRELVEDRKPKWWWDGSEDVHGAGRWHDDEDDEDDSSRGRDRD
jgi:hypothetical protein